MPRELEVEAPVKTKAILDELRVGDIFYVSGLIATARDEVYKRIAIMKEEPPISLEGWAIFHAGPIMKLLDNKWHCLSIGPTTSIRLEKYSTLFMEKTKPGIIIGKGGMGENTAEACRKHKSIYAIFPGGCGVLGASYVKEVLDVKWLELGMPEAIWIMRVERLGPLIVSIDTTGRNLTEEIKTKLKKRLKKALISGRNDLEEETYD